MADERLERFEHFAELKQITNKIILFLIPKIDILLVGGGCRWTGATKTRTSSPPEAVLEMVTPAEFCPVGKAGLAPPLVCVLTAVMETAAEELSIAESATWLLLKSTPLSCFSLQWPHTSKPMGRMFPLVV